MCKSAVRVLQLVKLSRPHKTFLEPEQITHGLLHAHCFDMYTLILLFVPVYGILFTFGAFALPLPSTYYSESL